MRAFALCLALALACTFATVSGWDEASAVRLKTISARANGSGASLVIEATEPMPYVATRPDPLTLLVDFGDIDAAGVDNALSAGGGPIASVSVEPAGGRSSASRVRISLAEPLAHRIRSERNRIVIDFDRTPGRSLVYAPRPAPADAPDAMLALQADRRAIDPIAALGLDRPAPAAALPAAIASSGAADGTQAPTATTPPAPAAQAPAGPAPQPGQTPAVPAPQPGQTPAVPAPGQRQFTGNPISLDFQGADLRAVLRTFAEISGLNIVIDPAVQGTVDVALRDVPWDQALDVILRANKLGYIIDGTIVRVAPLTVLASEEAERRKLTEEQALAGTLSVLTRTLSYAKAQDLVQLLTRSALSQRGSVQVDARTNTLIINDLPERLETASRLIETLDRAQPQVEIEARIVQTTKNYARALGIQWGFQGRVDPTLGNTTNLAFPNSGSVGGRGPNGTAVDLPVSGPSSIGLALGSINGAFNLDVALSALESSGNARLLSTPRVTTQNNIQAEIAQGVQVPYQTTANNTITTQFRDAALVLRVQPQITAAGTVIMNISVDNGSVGPTYNGVPSINTQRALTTVQVDDGQTTVLGGIYASNERETNDRTPGLSRIPFLNWFFKRDQLSDEATELLIFITPRIIK
ncbi:MAG: type IV pilus secretin PilQ [Acidobacteria bacterium]|nr:type IV pilus secretin PilQ [Acidobacteriota bacterium]